VSRAKPGYRDLAQALLKGVYRMSAIWSRAYHLKGQTLHTLARQKPFEIVDVLADRIVFVPQQGKGTERWASREQIERIDALMRLGKELTQELVRLEYPNDYNTSYITAIVHVLTHAR
jgi:hypothetical protein